MREGDTESPLRLSLTPPGDPVTTMDFFRPPVCVLTDFFRLEAEVAVVVVVVVLTDCLREEAAGPRMDFLRLEEAPLGTAEEATVLDARREDDVLLCCGCCC